MKILLTGGSGFIGTNLIELLLKKNIVEFINVDKRSPINIRHTKFWVDCNILETEKLQKVFDDYKPTHVIHLAARTDTASEQLEDYYDNIDGTKSLIKVLEKSNTVVYVIITSTQYVYKSSNTPFPTSDEHFEPHTAYGFSKKINEVDIRSSKMKTAWSIIRPTNVWGPWNMRYPNELLKIIYKGWYLHPRNVDNIKSYAYVKNVVHQIYGMLISPIEIVEKQVFYVGDYPMNSKNWLNAFSIELTGKTIRMVPKSFLYLLSVLGTYLNKLKIKFPLSIMRFENMIDNYDTPMKKTIDKFGLSHPNLQENVHETINWITTEGKPFFPFWKNK